MAHNDDCDDGDHNGGAVLWLFVAWIGLSVLCMMTVVAYILAQVMP